MNKDPLHFLVLCTGNSARSIMGEVLLNELGAGRIHARSAGSQPTGVVNPGAIAQLQSEGHSVDGLQSKSWDVFADGAADTDIIITVCDNAAGEACPVVPRMSTVVHWGIPDPAAADEAGRAAAFRRAYRSLRERVELLLEVPLEALDPRQYGDALARIHDAVRSRERA